MDPLGEVLVAVFDFAEAPAEFCGEVRIHTSGAQSCVQGVHKCEAADQWGTEELADASAERSPRIRQDGLRGVIGAACKVVRDGAPQPPQADKCTERHTQRAGQRRQKSYG